MSKLYFHGGRKKRRRKEEEISFRGYLSPAQIELSLSWGWAKADQKRIMIIKENKVKNKSLLYKSVILFQDFYKRPPSGAMVVENGKIFIFRF